MAGQILRGEIYCFPFGDPLPKLDEETGEPILDAAGEVVLEQKKRTVVVMSRDTLNNGNYVVVVPCYSQQVEKRTQYRQNVVLEKGEGNLRYRCVVRTDQIAFLDKKFVDWQTGRIGRLPPERMRDIVRAARWMMRDDELSEP